jgi:tetratricopeptide (TPR) repeat protein
LLARLEGETSEWGYEITVTWQSIGRCLAAQGRPSQAADCYRRALALAQTLEKTETLQKAIAVVHTDLADVLCEAGQYAESRSEYETGLELAKKVNDDRQQGVVLGQLGTLALRQGDLNEARRRYLEALRLFQRMGEDQSEAVIWHQLGIVAQAARDWDEAEHCYKQSLTIKESLGDWALAATSCGQLSNLAQEAGRPQDAERWMLRAIELFEKVTDTQNLAKGLSNLAALYLAQNRLDEAETYARRALAIKETLDLSSEPWTTYSILAELAGKRGRMDEARAWRRKEQESFAAFAGSDIKIQQWQQEIAIMVAACQGNQQAMEIAKQIIEKYSGDESWGNLAGAMQRVLNGERGDEIYDGLDREDALVIRRILQALNGEQTADGGPQTEENRPRSTVNGQPQQEQAITISQLLDMVERAADGDQQLGGQLFTAFQQMARAEDPTLSALGGVLLRVLIGERNPNLDGLPDEVASAVRGLLGRLKNR